MSKSLSSKEEEVIFSKFTIIKLSLLQNHFQTQATIIWETSARDKTCGYLWMGKSSNITSNQ